MVNKNEVITQATYVLAAFGLGGIDKIRICEVADKGGDLWSHAMLGYEDILLGRVARRDFD